MVDMINARNERARYGSDRKGLFFTIPIREQNSGRNAVHLPLPTARLRSVGPNHPTRLFTLPMGIGDKGYQRGQQQGDKVERSSPLPLALNPGKAPGGTTRWFRERY